MALRSPINMQFHFGVSSRLPVATKMLPPSKDIRIGSSNVSIVMMNGCVGVQIGQEEKTTF